jgi:hypothetical protein
VRGSPLAHAEVEATLADMIERRDVLGQPQGMDERQDLNAKPILTRLVRPR